MSSAFRWPFVTHEELSVVVTHLHERISLMASQADIDALTAQVNQVATDLASAHSALQSEIDALAAQNPGVDLTALQNAVEPLDAAVQALGTLQPSPPTGQ